MNVQEDYQKAMDEIAFSTEELHILTQKLRRASEEQEETLMKPKNKRTVLRPLLIAALVLLVAFSAAAAVRFIVPKKLSEDLQLDLSSLQPVVDMQNAEPGSVRTVQKTQKTNGLVITFEAIAKGKSVFADVWKGEGTVQEEATYAIFTIRREDGAPFYGNQDGKGFTLPYQAASFGYNLLLKGYSPNASALIDHHGIFNYEEGNVLYKAYDITDALCFADKAPYIVINDGMICSPDILRIDRNGDFYYADGYTGIRALFDLNLDPALADPEMQQEVLAKDPMFTYDEIVAVFAKDGQDYDTYTFTPIDAEPALTPAEAITD